MFGFRSGNESGRSELGIGERDFGGEFGYGRYILIVFVDYVKIKFVKGKFFLRWRKFMFWFFVFY